MDSEKEKEEKLEWDKLVDAIENFVKLDVNESNIEMLSNKENLDEWTRKLGNILNDESGRMDTSSFDKLEDCFNQCEAKLTQSDKFDEYEMISTFVFNEQNLGRNRRNKARKLAATEEKRLALDIAQIKGYRLNIHQSSVNDELQNKISDAERSYIQRKMVFAKSAQVASADCRVQFTRVRAFFGDLHKSRLEILERQYMRSLKLQTIKHRLLNTDGRVRSLDEQTVNRIYHKKKTDLNELHMAQNLEEAMYLETMIDLLDVVQEGKENAALELFQFQVQELKDQVRNNAKRVEEFNRFMAEAALEKARLEAHYLEEQFHDMEGDEKRNQQVDATESQKDFYATTENSVMSVSKLYDSVLWSVATNQLGLSTEASSMYSSECDKENDDDTKHTVESEVTDTADRRDKGQLNETGSTQSGSTVNVDEEHDGLSFIGKMHVKQLVKEIRSKEKALSKKHEAEIKLERRKYRSVVRALKKKHQIALDEIVQKCVIERHKIRDAITQRMALLEERQEASTMSVQKIIEQDVKLMRDAWAEHKRLEAAEKSSFAKAQALVSAQVFHEVRNALSSVISMSEMTSTLKKDSSISPTELLSSVNEMLDQIKEVVNYALDMLNNVLDLSKIKSGSYHVNKKLFDLQDLLNRATRMQLVKARARNVKMSFVHSLEPIIAYTDNDILVRIIANFISNAVKFTHAGAVQPFVWPLKEILSHDSANNKTDLQSMEAGVFGGEENLLDDLNKTEKSEINEFHPKTKLIAVGVADTGIGLKKEVLKIAEAGLSDSDSQSMVSGAKNSGFGLHLIHQLAKTLNSRIHLCTLEDCRNLLSTDMLDSMMEYHKLQDNPTMKERADVKYPGPGTVLYITVPVCEDNIGAQKALNSSNLFDGEMSSKNAKDMKYAFCPQPAPDSVNGSFRILVADDVFMLRKGMVNIITNVFSSFPDCPVSIYTACTAEDMLRVAASQPLDLIISDNQFALPTNVKQFSREGETAQGRPHIFYMKDTTTRKSISNYFVNEEFDVREGDGLLAGFDALKQLESEENPPFPTPVLMLLTGHNITAPPNSGIIVTQKPLRKSGFVPLLELKVRNLIKLGVCVDDAGNSTDSSTNKNKVCNRHGSQLFVHDDLE